jgi:tellurite resistance protein TerC
LALATCFGLWIGHAEGRQSGLEFAAGYLIELSMSIDNLFIFLLMFAPSAWNRRHKEKRCCWT